MATGRFAGSAWADTSVDAETAVNNINKDNESDYYPIVINGILKPLDRITSDGTIKNALVSLSIASMLYVLLPPLIHPPRPTMMKSFLTVVQHHT